jgi:hypothetical protein
VRPVVADGQLMIARSPSTRGIYAAPPGASIEDIGHG